MIIEKLLEKGFEAFENILNKTSKENEAEAERTHNLIVIKEAFEGAVNKISELKKQNKEKDEKLSEKDEIISKNDKEIDELKKEVKKLRNLIVDKTVI